MLCRPSRQHRPPRQPVRQEGTPALGRGCWGVSRAPVVRGVGVRVWGARSERTLWLRAEGTSSGCELRGVSWRCSWGAGSGRAFGVHARDTQAGELEGCALGVHARGAPSGCSLGACELGAVNSRRSPGARAGGELGVLSGCSPLARAPDASLGWELRAASSRCSGGAVSRAHAWAASSERGGGALREAGGGGGHPSSWGAVPPARRFPRGRLFVSGNGFCMWQLLQERAALPKRACAGAREGEPGGVAEGRKG